MTMTTNGTVDTWLHLLDLVLMDVPVDGHGRLRDNVARLRADMLNAQANWEAPPSEPQMTNEPPSQYREDDFLPPMVPVEGAKRKTLSVTCPTCAARPGVRCFRMTSRGKYGQPTDQPLVMGDGKISNHARRVQLARSKPT